MNKTAIKNYAIWAREQLIESCKQRAFEYGITEDGNYASSLRTVGSRILTDQEAEQRTQLIGQIKQKGYAQVIEETAYTWFNRFIALRFMEVNGYLPSKVRVFTDETGAFKPEIIKEAMAVDLEGIDRAAVIDLVERQDNESLYKYLLIAQCNTLSAGLPYMFDKISNWTELLFPANLLRTDSVVGRMISDIPEDDWTDAVQIIGWLYQYYNSELKDETFALLKKNVKITKERIPAATQLFTPDWIVRYMVENSLGRLWYKGHKDFNKSSWKYYLDEAEQEPEVEAELIKIRADYSHIRPEEIKVIDPCMGSGHILVYAFDVLMQIYTSMGWSERDAALSIIENNLYGLDIDDRAGQLAYFAVMMKARKYSRRIMNMDVKPNVMSIQESSFMTSELIDFVAGNDASIKTDLRRIKEIFTDAKEYGSILDVPPLGYEAILERIDEIKYTIVEVIFQIEHSNVAAEQLRQLINQAMIMSQKYDVVLTNPPYMGNSGMSIRLGAYVKNEYPKGKTDLFAVFIEKCGRLLKDGAFQAMITQHSWMFLSSFEELRHTISRGTIINMIHLGARAFDDISGEVVQTTSFVLCKTLIHNYKGYYYRLVEAPTQEEKEKQFLDGESIFIASSESYSKVPGSPLAYWMSPRMIELFRYPQIENYVLFRQGMATSDNKRFLRLWFEVSQLNSCYSARDLESARESKCKWFAYNKGGTYRKWYGNTDYVVNWENDGYEMKAFTATLPQGMNVRLNSREYYFKECYSWSKISTGQISFRYYPSGFVFDVAGCCVFECGTHLKYYLGLSNSVITGTFVSCLSPTLNFELEHLKKVPVVINTNKEQRVDSIVDCNITLAKQDWDSFEISWNFKKHPLI